MLHKFSAINVAINTLNQSPTLSVREENLAKLIKESNQKNEVSGFHFCISNFELLQNYFHIFSGCLIFSSAFYITAFLLGNLDVKYFTRKPFQCNSRTVRRLDRTLYIYMYIMQQKSWIIWSKTFNCYLEFQASTEAIIRQYFCFVLYIYPVPS